MAGEERRLPRETEERILRENSQCALAVGRRDGSPGISLIDYHYDGTDIIMQTTTPTAKWHCIGRQPKVAALVQEGRGHVVVYGTCERIESEPERSTLMGRVLPFVAAQDLPPEEIAAMLDAGKRVVLRLTPEKVVSHS